MSDKWLDGLLNQHLQDIRAGHTHIIKQAILDHYKDYKSPEEVEEIVLEQQHHNACYSPFVDDWTYYCKCYRDKEVTKTYMVNKNIIYSTDKDDNVVYLQIKNLNNGAIEQLQSKKDHDAKKS